MASAARAGGHGDEGKENKKPGPASGYWALRKQSVTVNGRRSHTPKQAPTPLGEIDRASALNAPTPLCRVVQVVQLKRATGASERELMNMTQLPKTTVHGILADEKEGGALRVRNSLERGGGPKFKLTDEHAKLLWKIAEGAPFVPDTMLVVMAQKDDSTFPDLTRRTVYNYLYVYASPPFRVKGTALSTTIEKNHVRVFDMHLGYVEGFREWLKKNQDVIVLYLDEFPISVPWWPQKGRVRTSPRHATPCQLYTQTYIKTRRQLKERTATKGGTSLGPGNPRAVTDTYPTESSPPHKRYPTPQPSRSPTNTNQNTHSPHHARRGTTKTPTPSCTRGLVTRQCNDACRVFEHTFEHVTSLRGDFDSRVGRRA